MPVLGQTPVRTHWEDSESITIEKIGSPYVDPNDSTKLVQDVKSHRVAQAEIRSTTSETIDDTSLPLVILTDASPAAPIGLSLDSSVPDGFVRNILNESTQTATLTPDSGDINDGTGAVLSVDLAAGASCELVKTSSGSPAVAHWKMLKGAGSDGTGTATIVGVQQESYSYAADSGAANTYAVTISPAPTIVAGSKIIFKAAHANTGTSTLNVNSGGAVAIKKNGTYALDANDISAGQIITVVNDGTYWQMASGALGATGATGGTRWLNGLVNPGEPSDYPTLILGETGLVRLYRFNSDLTDSTGNGNASVNAGTMAYGTSLAALGTCIVFSGSNSCVITRPVQDDFSIEFWFKTTNTFGSGSLYYQGSALIGGEVGGVVNDFGISIISAGRLCAGTGNPDGAIFPATSYNDGAWHHVVFTRKKSTGAEELWVDGVSKGSRTGNTNSLNAASQLQFAANPTGFVGSMDEIAFYNVVLTSAQIINHYNSGISTPTGVIPGNDGDYYINTITRTLFGPRTSGSWPRIGQINS